MAHEKTTLEQMKTWQAVRDKADAESGEAMSAMNALASGTSANIDGMRVKLLEEGRVVIYPGVGDAEFVIFERQFRGLMGWGDKHFGIGNFKDEKGDPGITPTQPPPAGRTR